jgi:hypothetical protein
MHRLSRFATPASRRAAVVAVGAALAASAACSQGKAERDLMMRWGGVLAPDCGNYLLPQLKYLGDSLVVQDRGKPILTGRDVRSAPAHFGAKPPPGFDGALTSRVGGEALVFVFYREPSGLYAVVEGGPKVMAALPAALRGRVRHCDPNRNRAPGAPLPSSVGPPDLLRDASFRRPYVRALGPLAREDWLMRLDGPAPPVKTVHVGGRDWQLVSVCKNHDCHDHNLVLLYAADAKTVYGLVHQRGRSVLVGAPPPPVAAELERIWKAEWRRGK